MKTIWWVTIAVLLTNCGEAVVPTKSSALPAPPVSVRLVAASENDWPLLYEATGTVRARNSAVIAAKMTGYVREVRVSAGDHVREGELLLTLDARDLDVAFRHAEAALDEVRSAVPEADSAVAGAQANVDFAQTTFGRMQDLWNRKSISNQEFDEASAKLKAARSGYQIARSRRAQVEARTARVQQEVEAAEIARGYARITAPFSGVVTARSADPGVLAMPGTPLLTIERGGAYRLEASAGELHLSAIQVGQPVTVTLDAIGRTLDLRVSEIVPSVDPESHSYLVRIDLPLTPALRSGEFGRAAFQLASRPALTIPAAAITDTGQLQSVFVAEAGVAHTRLITTGQKGHEQVEILSGLGAGETVVFPVPRGLLDGARVEARP